MKSVKKQSSKGLTFSMTEESMRINNEQTGRHDGEINYSVLEAKRCRGRKANKGYPVTCVYKRTGATVA